ncbi:hypothetical protein A0257_21080 [Hymenobacter psoromatis]|nr:hypothetical protein A0257_21080 [Hymenobacter psoromatis]
MLRAVRLPLFAAALALGAFTSCKKDNSTGLQVQAHDQSALMTIMHTMMKDMSLMKPTGDPDNDFAMMMVMHHQGAVNMANEELKNGKDAEMRALATSIIAKQQDEIKQFTAFLTAHPAHAPFLPDFAMMQDANMMRMDQANDLRPLTGDTDYDYAQLMVDHHQSAVENSDLELKYGRETTTKTLAQNIITDQKMEIDQFQAWLLKNKKF